MIALEEQETALVIDHYAGVFHLSSSRIAFMTHLKKTFPQYAQDDGEGTVYLSNVPLSMLTKIHWSRASQTYRK